VAYDIQFRKMARQAPKGFCVGAMGFVLGDRDAVCGFSHGRELSFHWSFGSGKVIERLEEFDYETSDHLSSCEEYHSGFAFSLTCCTWPMRSRSSAHSGF
jgi:hypothetical protein